MRKYQLRVKLTDLGGPGKEILKKDLPELMKKAKKKNTPIVGLSGIEPGSLKPQQKFYLITTEEKKDREVLEKESTEDWKMNQACGHFFSQMHSLELWSEVYRLIGYEKKKERIEKVCAKLTLDDRVEAYMQLEFVAQEMASVAFSIGYVMGQLYDVKDRQYFNQIKEFVTKNILPYVPYVPRKKAA